MNTIAVRFSPALPSTCRRLKRRNGEGPS